MKTYTIHYMDSHRLARCGQFALEEARQDAQRISAETGRPVILREHTPMWYNDSRLWTSDWWVAGVHRIELEARAHPSGGAL